jgi:hypothetical protein
MLKEDNNRWPMPYSSTIGCHIPCTIGAPRVRDAGHNVERNRLRCRTRSDFTRRLLGRLFNARFKGEIINVRTLV